MKKAVLILTAFLGVYLFPQTVMASPAGTDTSIIHHIQDGKLQEWPAEKFTADSDTKIKCAIDNDSHNLYVALLVPEISTQMKMMRTGMTVYVDLKAKRKENRGIEFPVKPERGESFAPADGGMRNARNEDEQQDPSKREANRLMMRNAMVIKQLNTIKINGFAGSDPVQQVLDVPGSIRVAYKCDTSETMEIEYCIPLSLLGDVSKLHEKEISIGCKIHAMELPSGGAGGGGMGGMGGGMRGGRGMGGRGGMGGGMNSGMSRETMMREQSFWAKYSFTGI